MTLILERQNHIYMKINMIIIFLIQEQFLLFPAPN